MRVRTSTDGQAREPRNKCDAKNGARMREFADAYVETRARMGLPPVPVENIVYARVVEIVAERMRRVDLLTGRDVAAAVRSTKAAVHSEDRQQQFEQLVKALVVRVHRSSARYTVGAKIENQARAHRGKPRAPVDLLVVQLAMKEVVKRMPTNRLTVEDARRAVRVASVRISMTVQPGVNATYEQSHRRPFG